MNLAKVSSLAAVSVFAFAAVAGAQSPSPSPTPTPAPRFPRVWNRERKLTAETIAVRLQGIARRRTAAYEKLLTQLYRILDRISAAADRREARGADVAAVREAVAKARAALDEARAAIRDLASKEYVFDEATDLNVGDLLRAARQELGEDLRTVHEKLKAAHAALREAVRALNRAHVDRPDDTASESDEGTE